jgi:hypothetical protein
LQIGLEIEEAKQAHEAEMKRRYPFFHAHMECLREKKWGSKEGNPHKGRTGEAEVDYNVYCVPMSQVEEYPRSTWKSSRGSHPGGPSCAAGGNWRQNLARVRECSTGHGRISI